MPDLSGREMTPDERNDLANASISLILAATATDLNECERIVSTVGNEYGHHGVGLLCCSMAAAVTKVTGLDGAAAFQIRSMDGQVLAPEDLPDEIRPVAWAHRFVATYANDGARSALPLFYSLLDNQQEALDSVSALVILAGEYVRWSSRQTQEARARLN